MEERFIPYHGLVSDTPRKGELLVLTNHRVISFIQSNGHKETFFAPLAEMKGISVRANTRGLKSLSQGLIMMILGVLAYLIIGYVLDSVTIGLALGATIILVGGLFIVRHFFWEEEGVIIFQGGSRELSFPYKSNIAGGCVYNLVNRFFQLKQHTKDRADHQASAEDGPRDNQPYEAPPTPAPEDDAFVSYSSEYSPWGYPPYELPDPPAPEDDASVSYSSEDVHPGAIHPTNYSTHLPRRTMPPAAIPQRMAPGLTYPTNYPTHLPRRTVLTLLAHPETTHGRPLRYNIGRLSRCHVQLCHRG